MIVVKREKGFGTRRGYSHCPKSLTTTARLLSDTSGPDRLHSADKTVIFCSSKIRIFKKYILA